MAWELQSLPLPDSNPVLDKDLAQVLGYLNFSSGASDAPTLACLNRIYERVLGTCGDAPAWRAVADLLRKRLDQLSAESTAFRDAEQATAVLGLVFEHTLPGYREFHRDLLYHQSDATLFGPFFVGRTMEAVLSQGPPWDDSQRITKGAIRRLNDYVGHRPVATLENHKGEPYAHERVRPIPLYIRDAGVAVGTYQEVIEVALEMLRQTDESLLRAACFDLELLDELALDPRAYDFDHPVHKRQNYHFGQWDPHHLDNQGRYRRFVVQPVTMDALWSRPQNETSLPSQELVVEAGAVLAGTILMSSGISGSSPDTHDSTVTLSRLLTQIAAYRDEFYQQLLGRMTGPHAERLRHEAIQRRQPFGGARQHLNAQLARSRACQLEHVHLARMYARMGRSEAACRESVVVPSVSARMTCQIDCWLTEGHAHVEAGRLEQAAELLPAIMETLQRAIECGAVVDPWNILGYDGQFSLFPSAENSVVDHRVEELVELMEQVFALNAEIWREAAANDNGPLCERVQGQFRETVDWWRKYAVHEVSSVDCPDPLGTFDAARRVAHALNLWQKGGAEAGDVRFWSPHADMFDSPKAYALVIEALMERGDFVAARALLMHWLGQVDRVPLEQGQTSFCRLAQHWVLALRNVCASERQHTLQRSPWRMLRRFFDFLEANAEQYWHPPNFCLRPAGISDRDDSTDGDLPLDEEEADEDLFGAAYQDVVYRDSTDDGMDGAIFEEDTGSNDSLVRESQRLAIRLSFLATVARLWRLVAVCPELLTAGDPGGEPANDEEIAQRLADLQRWSEQAHENQAGLLKLLEAVHAYHLPVAATDHDSMVEYDRRRMVKESILERAMSTLVFTADARRWLRAAATSQGPPHPTEDPTADDNSPSPRKAAETAKHGPDAADGKAAEKPPGEAAEKPAAKTSGKAASSKGLSTSRKDDSNSVVDASVDAGPPQPADEEQCLTEAFCALLRRDVAAFRQIWPTLRAALAGRPLLYVPLAKGGEPTAVVAARSRQQGIQDLLAWLPRMGLIEESCQLVETARQMERNNVVGPGAVTDYDALFKTAYKSIIECLVVSSRDWEAGETEDGDTRQALIDCMDQVSEALLASWLAHSRTLRLSVLERFNDRTLWKKLVPFIQTYGGELFSQAFLNLGNLRAILHQGTDAWLKRMEYAFNDEDAPRLVRDLDGELPRREAVELLTLVLEAVAENYGEYRDYNSTTTQSDRGEMLFTLLDFLRLRTRYDRVCWNLKPYVMAHEILVRHGEEDAARIWREAVTERVDDEALQYLKRLAELQQAHAMQMPTIADRLAERFVRPMVVDRMRALVEPALQRDTGDAAFAELEQEVNRLTKEPTGVGLDVPAWLIALEDEVERARRPLLDRDLDQISRPKFPPIRLSLEEVQRQLDAWNEET